MRMCAEDGERGGRLWSGPSSRLDVKGWGREEQSWLRLWTQGLPLSAVLGAKGLPVDKAGFPN